MNEVTQLAVQDLTAELRPHFKKNDMPLTMQYLGGKSRIVNFILDSIQRDFSGCTNFIDLFSGSGVVAYTAADRGYDVVANDIQPYSATLLRGLLRSCPNEVDSVIVELGKTSLADVFGGKRQEYYSSYKKEQDYFILAKNSDFDWKGYKEFCEATRLCSGSIDESQQIKKNSPWTLFLAYYSNTYFGVKQCAELDFLKQFSFTLGEELRQLVDACVVSVMTEAVSSTTHLAQYLKPKGMGTAQNLIKKRSKSILDMVLKRLNLLKYHVVSSSTEVYNLDYEHVFDSVVIDSASIVYADPPYFKEHYSRYYHVLDTYVLYDYPELTYNKTLGKTTIGRYREGRIISPFGKRSTSKQAFERLLNLCMSREANLAISYACSSILDLSFFKDLADKHDINILVDECSLMHTGQGRPHHKEVVEYLIKYKIV